MTNKNTKLPIVILVNPQMGENIGATARAMANFGLKELRLVNPRDGWPNDKAIGMATGAFDAMVVPYVYDTLSEALHDCHYALATTARQRDLNKPVYSPDQGVQEGLSYTQSGQKVAFVFGGERSGMDNDDLSLCNGIINIPTDPEFSSLNLGQAVLLIAYCISQSMDWNVFENDQTKSPPARREDLFNFLDRLEHELDEADFFKAEGLRPTMVRNIQNIFTRGDLSEQEVRTLQGILSALLKS